MELSNIGLIKYSIRGDNDTLLDTGNTIIKTKDATKQSGDAQQYGVYNLHMGAVDRNIQCKTCRNQSEYCPGHYGRIEATMPVMNPLFKSEIMKWIKIVCNKCGSLVIPIPTNVPQSRVLAVMSAQRNNTPKGGRHCKKCSEPLYDITDKGAEWIYFKLDDGKKRFILPKEIGEILGRITDDIIVAVGRNVISGPRKLILNNLIVAPNTIRPNSKGNIQANNNNDITQLYSKLQGANLKLGEMVNETANDNSKIPYTLQILQSLYDQVTTGKGGIQSVSDSQKPVTLADRPKGKVGSIRERLLSKRVSYVARDTITGDPSIPPDVLVIPKKIASNIYIKEVVHKDNFNKMKTIFDNGLSEYPGCKSIISAKTGGEIFWNTDYVLNEGDTIYRNIIDGDVGIFNREPSTKPSQTICLKVQVSEYVYTYSFNPIICECFNADFDGDEMTMYFAESVQSVIEIITMVGLNQSVMSYGNSKPLVAPFQDDIMGMSELTKDNVKINKFDAMQIMNKNNIYKMTKNTYTGRELVSLMLSNINIKTNASFYKDMYKDIMNYSSTETDVVIENGKVITGILDKNTIGGKSGGIIHKTVESYGNHRGIKIAYDLQQIGIAYLSYCGYTVSIKDVIPEIGVEKKIHKIVEGAIAKSIEHTRQLDNGDIIPDLKSTVKEFYEQGQINILTLGDEIFYPIYKNIDQENYLYKMAAYGAKGKDTNLMKIMGCLSLASLSGKRIETTFADGRTSVFSFRHDTDPMANGFIANSFTSGLTTLELVAHTKEARISLINKYCNTSITGDLNRKLNKALETNITDNFRRLRCGRFVVQFIYGENGIDSRKVNVVKIPTILLTNDEMKNKYLVKNTKYQKILDDEFTQLVNDRDYFRSVFLNIEMNNRNRIPFKNKCFLPIDVEGIINNKIYLLKNYTQIKNNSNIGEMVTMVKDFCNKLKYVFYNTHMKEDNAPVAENLSASLNLLNISVRSQLCSANMIKLKLNTELLEIIFKEIEYSLIGKLVDYGKGIGFITAQCICEPLTQRMLDSMHTVGGGGGGSLDFIKIVKNIIYAKPTEKLSFTEMYIPLDGEYKFDKVKTDYIATMIKEVSFEQLIVKKYAILYEKEIGKQLHEDYKYQNKMVTNFLQHNVNMIIPKDLAPFVYSFELDKTKMYIINISVNDIVREFRKKLPDLFVVYDDQNEETITMKFYLRTTYYTKSNEIIDKNKLFKMENMIKDCIVRGVKDIKNTEVKSFARHYINEKDGSLEKKQEYYIHTIGSNLTDILDVDHIDVLRVETNSPLEMESVFGIECGRTSLLNELRSHLMDSAIYTHFSVIADIMSVTGKLTALNKTGSTQREKNNVLLHSAASDPIKSFKDGAINNAHNDITGFTSSLMIGATPKYGSTYNDVCINEEFIKEFENKLIGALNDL